MYNLNLGIMNKIAPHFCMIVLLFLAGSCIKDDLSDCPSRYLVHVSVKDKNYSNVDMFSELAKTDENLPFRNFSGTVYYTLTNTQTGTVTEQSAVMQVAGDDKSYPITFNNIPDGDYVLTVWGNLSTDVPAGILHPDGKEHTDVYVGTGKLHFSSSYQPEEVTLERTKGGVLLMLSDFPASIVRVEETVDNVYQTVDPTLNYVGSTSVDKNVPFQSTLLSTIAPTSGAGTSKLNLRFYTSTQASEPIFTVPAVELNILRNQLAGVKIRYNQADGVLEVSTSINGVWTLVHNLDIDFI